MFRLARAPDVTMTAAPPEGPVTEGISSLEVRWILPGQVDTAMARRFAGPGQETESREDAYLLSPDVDGLSVKVRAGRALEVKVFRGSPGILDCPGRARGRMQCWQKWSFPFHPAGEHGGQDTGGPDGWVRVRKQRRISRFALTGGQIRRVAPYAGELAGEARCAVELTEFRMGYRDWWSLGLEATGPADLLRAGLESTAALVFGQALPGGLELRAADSTSYAEWLRMIWR